MESLDFLKDSLDLFGLLGIVEFDLQMEVARADAGLRAAEVLLQFVQLHLLAELVAEQAQLCRGDLAASRALGHGARQWKLSWLTQHSILGADAIRRAMLTELWLRW